ncbi:MAG: hypothetical protein JW797_04835 [Bradymonadales bacterium]|nr:hypothetical protein [Bradymonadales bacterium]
MMKYKIGWLLLLFIGVISAGSAGCGSEATLSARGMGHLDQADVTNGDVERDSSGELPPPVDQGDENQGDESQEAGQDLDLGPQPGGFLYPCEFDNQCDSGYCIQYEDDYVCTVFCSLDGGCPDGWSCQVIENTGSDAVRICVPSPDTLCRLCTSNSDCGAMANLCIEVGGERVCGKGCELSNDCPEGFYCTPRTDPAGVEARQCVPESEQCTCRPEFDGASRPCVWQNEYGVCEGIEVCQGNQGWSQCTAQQPRPEECDGHDNDCDGLTDENLDPRPCWSVPNEIGSCQGTETCQGASGWICDARTASIEICDGLDNDCNDVIDDGICFDGNDCTHDICRPEGGCDYPPRAGECNDDSLCTTNDHCVDGACTGAAITCDDLNPCTADTCDPLRGCVYTNQNGIPCETGNLCTNDTCQNGACTTGSPVACYPTDPYCTRASCNPSVGCVLERLTGNPCDDDDVCTVQDTCSNGVCAPGRPYCQGQPCSNCPDQAWGITLGSYCVDLFGPTCLCLCF